MLYKGNKTKCISFPIGGIGSGSIGLSGNGELVDWEIFNRPNKGSYNKYSFFTVKAEYPNGKTVVKVLQGDHISNLSGTYMKRAGIGFGHGADYWSMCGFPHFEKVTFDGSFPVARLTFEDSRFPAKVIMTAFNPFIPLDADASSIPAAFFGIKIISREIGVKYSVVLSVSNPFKSTENIKTENKYTAVTLKHSGTSEDSTEYGDITVAVDGKNSFCQEYWYRSAWPQDKLTAFWRELGDGELKARHYDSSGDSDSCSVGAWEIADKEKNISFRFVLSWNIPNNYNYWDVCRDKDGKDITWKNYYSILFENSLTSAVYSLDNWTSLFKRTDRFRKILHTSTLDKSVIDAVSSTISVLKSPTVLRLEDGTFYGWEGVHESSGSCEGTCTHVWSYAYALCFLFPDLERSLRDTEFKYDTDANGRMHFRTALPLGRDKQVEGPPCVDGQMATVIKIYRDWKLTGNTEWLKNNLNNVKSVLEYAWSDKNAHEWDKDHDGVLEGRQHHTLDMELFGPSSWLEGMYLCALKAASEMAEFLGDSKKKGEYDSLFKKGYEWTKNNLFNGEYFYHKVDLKNKNYTKHFNCPEYLNEENGQLKYQIGEGCAIDQILGQFHANLCGLGDIFDKEQRKTAIQSVLKYNFKDSVRDFVNMWRVFAINDEKGTVICQYPEGKERPIIPIPYCEECMTGFEYAFATLLITEGFIDEGLKAVRAVRDRYDGEKRNPWNEIECGSNYARAMSSFALIPAFSGFEYDIPNGHIGFLPKVSDIKCFWGIGSGWGEFEKVGNVYKITLAEGFAKLKSIKVDGEAKNIIIDGKSTQFTQKSGVIYFDETTVKKDIKIQTV